MVIYNYYRDWRGNRYREKFSVYIESEYYEDIGRMAYNVITKRDNRIISNIPKITAEGALKAYNKQCDNIRRDVYEL